ncbi:hypothetical protein WN48_01551 [Eufriesea mexicana]|nr:hypothetical protein WN48_01551 [Eufriesea mexicana]
MTGQGRMQQDRIHDDDLILRVVASYGSLHRPIRRAATDPPLTGSFFDRSDKTPSPSDGLFAPKTRHLEWSRDRPFFTEIAKPS